MPSKIQFALAILLSTFVWGTYADAQTQCPNECRRDIIQQDNNWESASSSNFYNGYPNNSMNETITLTLANDLQCQGMITGSVIVSRDANGNAVTQKIDFQRPDSNSPTYTFTGDIGDENTVKTAIRNIDYYFTPNAISCEYEGKTSVHLGDMQLLPFGTHKVTHDSESRIATIQFIEGPIWSSISDICRETDERGTMMNMGNDDEMGNDNVCELTFGPSTQMGNVPVDVCNANWEDMATTGSPSTDIQASQDTACPGHDEMKSSIGPDTIWLVMVGKEGLGRPTSRCIPVTKACIDHTEKRLKVKLAPNQFSSPQALDLSVVKSSGSVKYAFGLPVE